MNKTLNWIIAVIIIGAVIWFGFLKSGKPVSSEPIKIGAILPLTGPAAFVGEEVKNGIILAVDKINDKARKERIQLFIEDSGSNPKDGVSAYNKLEDIEKPDIYISALSSVSMALAPLIDRDKVILAAIVATAPNLTKEDGYVFRYYPTAKDETPLIVNILRNEKLKNLGVIYLNDDFGNSVNQELKDRFNKVDEKIISESFLISESDFRSHVTKIKSQGADSILAVGFDSHIKNIYTSARDLEFNGRLIGISTLAMPHLRDSLGEIIEDALVLAPKIYEETFEPSKEFISLYKNKYGKDASHYSANGYDTIMLINKIQINKQVSTRIQIVDYFNSLISFEGVFGSIKIDIKNREISFPLYYAKIKGGKLEYLEK